jgi:hypothetical protein
LRKSKQTFVGALDAALEAFASKTVSSFIFFVLGDWSAEVKCTLEVVIGRSLLSASKIMGSATCLDILARRSSKDFAWVPLPYFRII